MKEKSNLTKERRLRKKLYCLSLVATLAVVYFVLVQNIQAVYAIYTPIPIVFSPNGHTLRVYEAKLPTETEAGNMLYYYCDDCDKYYVDKDEKYEVEEGYWIIPRTPCDMSNAEYYGCGRNASGSTGTRTPVHYVEYRCTTHNYTWGLKMELCSPLGGDYVYEVYTPIEGERKHTHTTYGNCAKCGWTVDPVEVTEDCEDNDGDNNCDLCGNDIHIHNLTFYSSKSAGICQEGNSSYCYCNICKKYFANYGTNEIEKDSWIIPPTGHDMNNAELVSAIHEMQSNPNTHFLTYHCLTCNVYFTTSREFCDTSGKPYAENYERINGTLQHTHSGYKTCSKCGSYGTNPELFSETQDCSDDDGDLYCDKCGNYLHTHSMTTYEAKSAGICQAGNSTYYYCKGCNTYFSDAEGENEIEKFSWIIKATGHNMENCKNQGVYYLWEPDQYVHAVLYYCNTCSVSFNGESENCIYLGGNTDVKYEPLGNGKHTFSYKHACGYCKHEREWSEVQECSYGEWTVTKEASYTEEGMKVRTCSDCKSEDKQSIPKLEGLKIVTQPSDYNGKIGDSAVFTVEAAGEGLTYQWYYSKDGNRWFKSALDGYNSGTLNVTLTQARVNQMYRCLVTDNTGASITSESAQLTLKNSQLAIVTQPVDFTGSVGDTATFTVEAAGNIASYQWYYSKNNGDKWYRSGLTGYNSATLSVPVNEARMGQMYRCVITDEDGVTVTSEAATIKKKQSGITITSQPASAEVALRATATFTVEAQGESLEYQWYYSKDNGNTWLKSGMAGYNTNSLQVKAIASRNGQMYRCTITDANGVKKYSAAVSITIK